MFGYSPPYNLITLSALLLTADIALSAPLLSPSGSSSAPNQSARALSLPNQIIQEQPVDSGTQVETSETKGVNTDLAIVMKQEDARHLLARTGFGASPAALLSLTGLTRGQGVDLIIDGMGTTPTVPMPAWVDQPVPHYHARQDMDDNARAIFNNERDSELAQLRQWWILNMLQSESPQTERMVLFWHDLFATSYYETDRQSLAMARQNQTFREMGFGAWQDFLSAMIRDPALLEFLDARSNHKDSPNENLARELMELFTLGEGHYDETQVREAARSLTGHDVSRIHNLDFQLRTGRQDRRHKTLFGVSGRHSGDDLVELILRQPAAATFLATRFWHAFISDGEPDVQWLQSLSERFRQSGLVIGTLYRDMLESEAFWNTANRGMLIKSPIDLLVGTARTLEYPKHQWRSMSRWQAAMGMELFAPPNVAGWKEGAAFVTPGRLLTRHAAIDALLSSNTHFAASDMTMSSMSSASEPMASQEMIPNDRLLVAVAAENYRGAAQYQVSLFAGNKRLWQSDPVAVIAGQDTEQHGRIADMSELVWTQDAISAPTELLERTERIEITFINDDASASGDRNLYIDGLQLDDQWLSSSQATQFGECPPELSANAGRLYCAGKVVFMLKHFRQRGGILLPEWRASAVHVQWANENELTGRLVAELILDNLVTPDKRFHALGLRLESGPVGPLRLKLGTFGCWPDCFDFWPECAWADDHFPTHRVLTFPDLPATDRYWQAKGDKACHYTSLQPAEQQLVGLLWHNISTILAEASKTKRAAQFSAVLHRLSKRVKVNELQLANSPYPGQQVALEIDPTFAAAAVTRTALVADRPQVDTLAELNVQLHSAGLSLAAMLLPDLAISDHPARDAIDTNDVELQAIVNHPLFQIK